MLAVALLVFTCCSSIVMTEDAGVKDATFVGVIDKPWITPSGPVVNSKVKPFFPTMEAAIPPERGYPASEATGARPVTSQADRLQETSIISILFIEKNLVEIVLGGRSSNDSVIAPPCARCLTIVSWAVGVTYLGYATPKIGGSVTALV